MVRLSRKQLASLPADSLLRLVPVRQALSDPHFRCVSRPIDGTWTAVGLVEAITGYNPIVDTHYYATTSVLKRWLRDPIHLGRALNAEDHLAKSVLVMTHDWLHSWAYRTVEALAPELGVGRVPVTRQNLDEFTYVHLLTEAVACVGLDYWYLSLQDVNDVVDLGSRIQPMTNHYREADRAEYRRFHPSLDVQRPEFLLDVAKLYCADEVEGFSPADLERSPKLHHWISSELLAARTQRYNTRLWLSHVGGFVLPERDLGRPLPAPTGARAKLALDLGARLWQKIKHEDPHDPAPRPGPNAWTYRPQRTPDFRVYNLRQLPGRARYRWAATPRPRENFWFYAQQYVSQFRFPVSRRGAVDRFGDALAELRDRQDQDRLFKLCAGLTRVAPGKSDPGPLELIFLN